MTLTLAIKADIGLVFGGDPLSFPLSHGLAGFLGTDASFFVPPFEKNPPDLCPFAFALDGEIMFSSLVERSRELSVDPLLALLFDDCSAAETDSVLKRELA